MAHNGVVAGGGRLTDWISLGVLASSVPRDAVDAAVAAAGKGAKRSDGKLPPHVMVYFVMALALFAGEDYEEVATRLTETLASWGCWDDSWSTPTSGGITQARQRLGPEPLELLFDRVAVPVAGLRWSATVGLASSSPSQLRRPRARLRPALLAAESRRAHRRPT